MMYLGMNRNNGQAISDIEHIRQSVSDILITPVGSRIMRREYGSQLFSLLDQPQNPALNLQIMAAIYGAVLRWENRIILTAVNISADASGKMIVDLIGSRVDTGGRIQFSLPLRGQ
ncbi:baseplate assembly protein [Serratia fonticola]|uniref:GPW/gp25 family protein n=1 Tax=Serratia fonticola TaxID=47917 RepID=UPI00137789C7|nr:GPW/gp25 family protein [Serratia fonticola]NBJ32235.1 baseplate assembly protein [Serratia fonticola]